MRDGNGPYDDRFYAGQMTGSADSATVYAGILSRFFVPASVADIGCGRGGWLKAFKAIGATRLVGYDGDWNDPAMLDPSIEYVPCDLGRLDALPDPGRFDLAMSLEVAEHIAPDAAEGFVRFLAGLSDAILFGAAFTGQGGVNHVNEQPNSYWGRLFGSLGFVPFDLFRPVVWGDARVRFWYQQNTFLYVRRDGSRHAALLARGLRPLENLAFMDCIHPALYGRTLHRSFGRSLRMTLRLLMPALRRRLGLG